MRWVLGAAGALALMAATYLAMRPRLTRPVLRVGVQVRSGSAGHDAIAAGAALALEDRDERAGPFRVSLVREDVFAGKVSSKVWMPGLAQVPEAWTAEDGTTLIPPDFDGLADGIAAWANARGLRRVALPTSPRLVKFVPDSNSNYASLGPGQSLGQYLEKRMSTSDFIWPPKNVELPIEALVRLAVDARPDLIVLEGNECPARPLRDAGYTGPLFISDDSLDMSNPDLEGCLMLLAPLKPSPPDFRRRHPHPFAWAGYRGALRFLDALDEGTPPEELCFPSIFDDLVEAPRVYELRKGRFVASK